MFPDKVVRQKAGDVLRAVRPRKGGHRGGWGEPSALGDPNREAHALPGSRHDAVRHRPRSKEHEATFDGRYVNRVAKHGVQSAVVWGSGLQLHMHTDTYTYSYA